MILSREIREGQIWSHYKNPTHKYEIICIASNSENLEEMVVYKSLYPSETGIGNKWVRPKKMFLEKITKDEKEVERFSFVSEGKE